MLKEAPTPRRVSPYLEPMDLMFMSPDTQKPTIPGMEMGLRPAVLLAQMASPLL